MKIQAQVGQQLVEIEIVRENGNYVVDIDGKRRVVDARKLEADFYTILTENRSYEVSVEPDGDGYVVRHGAAEQRVRFTDPGRRAREGGDIGEGPEKITTAMPGRVVRILVAQGDVVEAGQGVVVVEAMKMENEIAASKAGTVKEVKVTPGQSVEGGAVLLVVE